MPEVELLAKVIAWRVFSMCYAFFIALAFTGESERAFGIVIVTGVSLTLLQWIFEVFWDKNVRRKLRDAFSGQQRTIDRVVRWRRDARLVRVDKHEQGPDGRQAGEDPAAPQDAG